jgi:drug/metabolite transporter (DMT)-like permease
MLNKNGNSIGIGSALASALFLGLAPVFGKAAINSGFSPFAVVAFRTSLAAILLLLIVVIFRRSFLYIYPAGFFGCALAGILNGIGSLFYYLALQRLSVSIGQLLYSLYPVFLVIWFIIDRQSPSLLTYLRTLLAIGGVVLLTTSMSGRVDWVGVFYMLAASILYAIHLPINQRVLYDVPAPTVTLYTLLAMSAVVIPPYFIFSGLTIPSGANWDPIFALTFVTFFSRLMLFLGIKKLGGMQTALLGLGELIVSISISHIWLHDHLYLSQWIGAGLLAISLFLVGFEKFKPDFGRKKGLLGWVRTPEITTDISIGPPQ